MSFYNLGKIFFPLIKLDLRRDYFGSYLGFLWVFIQPLSFIFVIYTVFSYGFRRLPTSGDVPFSIWLISGIIPWFFIANSISQGAKSIVMNGFFVRKNSKYTFLLPLVKIFSNLFIHLILMFFLILFLYVNNITFSIYWLQYFYYIFVAILFLSSIVFILASFRVFIKDIDNMIPIFIQLFFWLTPIFWNANRISKENSWIVTLNPFNYLIQGYRDTFIYKVWFWERGFETIYFLLFTLCLLFIAFFVFNKLKKHFGDLV